MVQLTIAFFYILGVFLSLALYGLYFVTFVISMYYLLRPNHLHKTPANKLLILADQIVLIAKQAMAPFIGNAIATPLFLLFIDNLSTADDTATLALFVAELAVSNTFLVTVLIVAIVTEIIFVNNSRHVGSDVNIFGSTGDSLLSYKIWRSQQLTKHATTYLRSASATGELTSNAQNILSIIVESAGLYTLSPSCALTLVDMAAPTIGIAFCLIIIRFGMGGAFKNNPQLSTVALPSSGNSGLRGENHVVMQPMSVHLTTHTQTTETVDISLDSDGEAKTMMGSVV
ncbi:hypothetical protein PHLGIDRAFT_17413 [Phlebiopsis gigantea 11061_1 CR5-6]|uniref:Uncharacterized protein n=1 Tax=Phlebiopsis gigantea (strain 11061_1 CR5-6) TaxID=745531 RepID=A0A0C3RYB5_PHLG1|nr:hypothetical protein PHLGIDRAFT_17413 [Phlebiopsis gigantea 11061_1 CR5-6]